MFFKSFQFFQLKEPASIDFEAMTAVLPEFALKEVGSNDWFTFGTLPLVRNSECWSIVCNDCMLIRFGKEEKSLPAAVVREALDTKIAEIELVEGRKIGRKEKGDIKDELVFTLRPKAFAKRSDIWLYIDKKAALLVLNTTNAGMTEQAFKLLQTMCGSFPMVPLQAQASPAGIMTDWLVKNDLPAILETGDECEVADNSEDKAKARFKNLEPLSEDVTRHLDQGMQVKSLGLKWSDKASFVLNDDLTIKKVKWDEMLKEAAFNNSQGGDMSDLDANFALMSLTVRKFFNEHFAKWFEIAADFEQEQAA
ncbi:recombination-associated protein RdgC [Marinomonas piezotolerans]|uniref:Recombination-associated protein RdgC n=1 Tax=Marinomonas piezotolerans TaxID=2213058 RepID=A0A370UA67_9GAMM|nr:recombination-associated protein RdgC [Marinomonas piezotolerans]RDL44653.1 recombination-associated protein RdgC [Marinomonas piezotolerans]